jgi:hypothetical protein
MKKNLRKELFSLFLIIAFPIHTWSLYQTLNNFEWVAERTIVWDAFGYGSYALTFALFETFLFFLVITPFYLLFRKNRDVDTAVAVFGTVFITISIWEILHRLNVANSNILDTTINQIRTRFQLRYRYIVGLYLVLIGIIASSISLPPFLIIKKEKYSSAIIDLLQRLELLSYLYLGLDLISIVIVIIRNTVDIQI